MADQLTLIETEPTTDPSTMLIRMAIEQGLDTDKLEKLIALRNAELDRQAKQDFDRHFSALQADLPTIKKGAEAKDRNGKTMYFYAPLETLQAAAGPVIARHGFSYSWREEAIETGGKRVLLTITGHGHSRDTSFDVPKMDPNGMQNPAQAAGVMSSYGKRYTFVAGFGLTVEGEDDDTNSLTFDDGVKYAETVNQINDCKTMDELQSAFPALYKQLEGDFTGRKALVTAKDAKKKELSNGPKNS